MKIKCNLTYLYLDAEWSRLLGFSSTMFPKIGMFCQPLSACMTLSYHSID